MKINKDRLNKIDKWAATLSIAGKHVKEIVQEMRLLMVENDVLQRVIKKKDEEIERLKSELEWIEKEFKEEIKEKNELIIH